MWIESSCPRLSGDADKAIDVQTGRVFLKERGGSFKGHASSSNANFRIPTKATIFTRQSLPDLTMFTKSILTVFTLVLAATATLDPATSNTKGKYPSSPSCSGMPNSSLQDWS